MADPIVGIVMGSKSDHEVMKAAVTTLEEFGVPYEIEVISAHRTPDRAIEYTRSARGRGLKVLIGGAGGAAHLPGVMAALTTLPVIGVPIYSKYFGGQDALMAIVQMPPGIPVATVAIDSAKNAALLALRILGATDVEIAAKLEKYRESMVDAVAEMNKTVKASG